MDSPDLATGYTPSSTRKFQDVPGQRARIWSLEGRWGGPWQSDDEFERWMDILADARRDDAA